MAYTPIEPLNFDWLGQLPARIRQTEAQDALKGLAGLDLQSPQAIRSAASKIISTNPQLAIQLLGAGAQQEAAQQRAANMDINTALLYRVMGGAAAGVPPVVVPGGVNGSINDKFIYTPLESQPQAPAQGPVAAPPWSPTPIPTLPFPSGSPGILGESSPAGSGLGPQFAGPGAQVPEPQPSVSEPLVAPMQFPGVGVPSASTQQPPVTPPPVPQPPPAVQSPSSGVVTQGQYSQSELKRLGEVTTQSGARLRPRDAANIMPLYRQQQSSVLGEAEKLALYNYDQRQRELQGLAKQPREVWDAAQELRKKELDQYIKITEGYYEDARKGQDVRQTLSALQAMVSNGAITGYGRAITAAAGSITNWVRSSAIQQGLDPKLVDRYIPKTLENYERAAGVDAAAKALHNGLVLAQAGSLSKGFSEGDRVYVDEQQPGLHMTGPAIEATIKYQNAIWQRKEDYARLATQYTKFELDHGRLPTRGGLQNEIAKFNGSYPLFQYKDKSGKYVKTALGKDIADGFAQGAGTNESGAAIPDLIDKVLGAVVGGPYAQPNPPGLDTLGGAVPSLSETFKGIPGDVSNYLDTVRKNDPVLGPLIDRFILLSKRRAKQQPSGYRAGPIIQP